MEEEKKGSSEPKGLGPQINHLIYLLLITRGNCVVLARRVLLKRWKYKLLVVLLLIPIVYILTVSRSGVTTTDILQRKHPNSLHDSIYQNSGFDNTKNYKEVSGQNNATTTKFPAGMVQMDWAKMEQDTTEDLFQFISAYYDSRSDIPGRPAIVVFAYVREYILKPQLRCVFKYSNGSKSCPTNVIAIQEIVNVFHSGYVQRKVKFKTIVCPLKYNDDIPVIIQFSSSTTCEQIGMSGEIPVRNRAILKKLPSKRIGVCLQGSLRSIRKKDMHQHVKNFISMCQYLGADFISMYASPEEVDHRILNDMLANYSHVVKLMEWKVFDHDYHGQFGIVHDCLYRHMYEAKYLAFFDLDEMIIPFQHDNWLEMLDELEMRGGDSYPGYSFMNRFYAPSNLNHSEILNKCAKLDNTSVYLSWFNERQCLYKHNDRSKMILTPTKIVDTLIHGAGKVVGDKDLFTVDKNFAINAHYRKSSLWNCLNHFTNDMFNRFRTVLDKYTTSICHL